MNTMKEKLWTVLVASVILQFVGEVDAFSIDLFPWPNAEVKEGNNLTLQCSCNASITPHIIKWYLNNDAIGLVIDTSRCQYLTTPRHYHLDRYTKSCHETKFNFTIANISKDDHQNTWTCDYAVMGMDQHANASTTIVVKDADADSVQLSPSPTAEVKEGNTLILKCSYNGSTSPDFINWYLNNDTDGLVIEASNCQYRSSPKQYDIGRYNISCHETEFYLTINSISKDKDHQDTWKCDTTVFGMHPPQKASTTIMVMDADKGKKDGQLDELKAVAITVTVLSVVIVAVLIAVARYLGLYRNRRNGKDGHFDEPETGAITRIDAVITAFNTAASGCYLYRKITKVAGDCLCREGRKDDATDIQNTKQELGQKSNPNESKENCTDSVANRTNEDPVQDQEKTPMLGSARLCEDTENNQA